MHRVLLQTEQFVLNLLATDQEMISRRFAGQHENRFEGIGYHLNHQGLVVLDGIIAHIECERCDTHDAGDHTIFIARATGGATAAGRPLLYYRGGYTELSDL
jgi:flavin reductase (DIM6/NTAB) family NADH-FMN oxidoreductase RutF